MKAILMSIRPQWVAKILNSEKTFEVRKKFPSDYVGWVYIYCTKGGDMICYRPNFDGYACVPNLYGNEHFNGKVVARFWCDKVEEIKYGKLKDLTFGYFIGENTLDNFIELSKKSCLECWELDNYLQDKQGFAIHITKLEIFDKPKEISEFTYWKDYGDCKQTMKLTRAPQSWCYIEI